MNDDINWDEMESDYIKFEKIGDEVDGVVLAVRAGTDFNGNPCPVIDLNTADGEKILSCGQANLKAQVVKVKPRAGDTLKVTFSGTEKVAKGEKKLFTLVHNGSTVGAEEAPF